MSATIISVRAADSAITLLGAIRSIFAKIPIIISTQMMSAHLMSTHSKVRKKILIMIIFALN